MERFQVKVIAAGKQGDQERTVVLPPDLLKKLGLDARRRYRLRFGTRVETVRFRALAKAGSRELHFSRTLANRLCLADQQVLGAGLPEPGELVLGPLIGLLTGARNLNELLAGKRDPVCCKYAQYAREVGAALCWLSVNNLEPDATSIDGYEHQCRLDGKCRWVRREFPIPRIIYDRCLGRREAQRARQGLELLGCTVLNKPVKVTKLDSFAMLRADPNLASYLPHTTALTAESLQEALSRYPDLYLKPNAMSKGHGVCRLRRGKNGWIFQSRCGREMENRVLSYAVDLSQELSDLIHSPRHYLLQEGLPLATYLGNRFDFRSLVQKDGRGEWLVGGLVARIAPQESAITSPRSGGHVARPELVLRQAFPTRWQEVLANLVSVSLLLARCVDDRMGPCAELGLDLGVLADGSIKLIEVNGKPLKVSLKRLCRVQVNEHIYRYPIHYAAFLELMGVGACSG